MTPLSELLQQGTAHAWLFIPSAILLGALHGLEPGHSKTMMAAFIIAVRGTVTQAVLLGLAATISHTAVVWAVALVGLHIGGQFDAETTEPYFQVASAVLIIGVALWMVWRTWRDGRQASLAEHDHHHEEEVRRIDTGHGILALEVFEEDVPPRWRVRFESGRGWKAEEVTITTERPDGTRQAFAFADRGTYLESLEEIPEPHAFTAHLCLAQGSATRNYDVAFAEHDHGHHHEGLDLSGGEYEDAHQRAHANDIRQRFGNRHVTTGQIIMFGLTGGLIPCPAAITVLLLCLQLKEFTLGVALVLCFSIGLALTMVTAGVAAALSVRHVSQRWSSFGAFAQRAPYFSSAVIICVGLYVGYQGLHGLAVLGMF
ncbi:nickel/cobalt efflux transporter [Paeniroseomonas aquatica]|uniref:Nickel/cobalt efflux system n=1 Tax=Paeniroseomonas aquatica TaxID=373043 RepID=A0ABT8A3U1_9PROT|nr:nickel/cobalt efflux transporter [Paeniroseomonas aquatica]MDN3564366.1 nickel/cobalt efflux transporter [Paeniroseomonas aquatica]